MATVNPIRKRRRLWIALGVMLVGVVALVAALPWVLGTESARRWMLVRANRALAPAALEFRSIRLSWFGPTRMTSFVLRDAEGERVVVARRATWDRSLLQILFDRPRYGTLSLEATDLDIQRRADGTVDLYEAVKPILSSNPKTELHIRTYGGRLRFRDAAQPAPVVADRAEVALDVLPAPGLVTWKIQLAKLDGPVSDALTVTGDFDRWAERAGRVADVSVQLKGNRWPWALELAELKLSGKFNGAVDLRKRKGLWSSSGDARLLALSAAGPRLSGDQLQLERVAGIWDLSQSAGSWQVRRLDVESALLQLKAQGAVPAASGTTARVEGTLDLAALARQIPHALRLREGITLERGTALVRLESVADAGRNAWDVEAKISDLSVRDHDRPFTMQEPATLSARLIHEGRRFAVDHMDVRTAFLNATGRGDVDRGVTWSGTLDLGGLKRQLHDVVDFGGIELAGRGTLAGEYRRTDAVYRGHMTTRLNDVRIGGLAAGTLERPAVELDLRLDGPADNAGLPRSWSQLQLKLESGAASAEATAVANERGSRLSVAGRTSFGPDERPRKAEGRLEAHGDAAAFDIDRLSLRFIPAAGDVTDEPIELAALGRFDRARGELELRPVAPAASTLLAIAPDGIHVSGLGKPGAFRAYGGLAGDVGSVLQLVSAREKNARGGPQGTWLARGEAESTRDGLRIVARLDLQGLSWSSGNGNVPYNEGPVAIGLDASYAADSDRIDLAELSLSSRYVVLQGSGRLTALRGDRLVDLHGTLTPDWEAINRLLAERVEPGANLQGKPRDWHLRGPLSGASSPDLPKALEGDFGFQLVDADIYGLHVGPAPVVVRARGGGLGLETIDTTLNGGRIHLEPKLNLNGEHGPEIRLGPESTITNAEINDEVSRRYLSYVAPVLDRATRAHGLVSVQLKEAVFPLSGAAKHGATVEGSVVFQDVEFVPGPFLDPIFDILGREAQPALKLNEPVALTIADRRVYQRGMAIPIGRLTRIELEGWVDFDRNLSLMASLPVTPAMVGNNPLLTDIVGGVRIRVPIRGTLRKPEIDRQVMNLALKDLGKSLLERGVTRGVADILLRLTEGRNRNAPPPLTREERKAQRQERREERRRQRDPEP